MKLSAQTNIFRKVGLEEKFIFTRHFAVMLKSGIPINEVLENLCKQTKNDFFVEILTKVTKDVRNGLSLEKALRKHPQVFDSFYSYMIKVGEESGTLEESLKYLAKQLKKDAEFRGKIASASLYPILVIATAVIVGGGVSFFVLPKMLDLFQSLDVNLPLSTRILLWVARFMKDFGVLVFGGLGVFGVVFSLLIKFSSVKYFWETCLLRSPYFGTVYQDIQVAQLCRNLGIMLKSGMPIAAALETQQEATSNVVYKKYVKQLGDSVKNGESMEAGATHYKMHFFPDLAIQMIAVGEKTGNLDDSLNYLGEFYDDEVENATKRLTSILEPVLLLGIGVVVAFVAMAIITPIYQFTGSIHR